MASTDTRSVWKHVVDAAMVDEVIGLQPIHVVFGNRIP